MAQATNVGFIGIGNMGRPMAANLARAGVPLTIFDADPAQSARFAGDHDCTVASSLAELGSAADIVITMLPTGPIVSAVVLGTDGDGLAGALAEGSIIVDMSSSEPEGTRTLGAELDKRGITLIDAPVSGGVPGAEAGTLAIMIGAADEAAVKRVEPFLNAMGKRLFRTGPLGSGHAMKALNNYVAAAGFTAAAEALIIGERFGLDRTVMVDVINNSSGRNFNTEHPIKDHVLPRSFAAGFKLGLMAKDVKIAGDLGEHLKVDAPLSRMVRERWADALAALGADQDFTRAITHWERSGESGAD
ncbi:MAG TPA: NAD(P)-dependent oxidoreductase [Alphaproteobacteria bacterium]|nr:NAD(P)-dependent oxidoreductase [Alphaproteobacteria bacterium]